MVNLWLIIGEYMVNIWFMGFHQCGKPTMDGLEWTSPFKWMMTGDTPLTQETSQERSS